MKKFIKKIVLFLVIMALVEQVISSFFPYHYGNPWYASKIEELNKREPSKLPQCVLFGSSRVYRQLNPAILDSTIERAIGSNLNTYNLGAPATFCPQTYFLAENFLKSNLSLNTKYLCFELMDLAPIKPHLMHEERSIYWINSSNFIFTVKGIMSTKNIGLAQKFKKLGPYLISYIENIFNYGKYGRFLTEKGFINNEYTGINKNGYYPLDLEWQNTEDLVLKKHYTERNSFITKNEDELLKRAEKSIDVIDGSRAKVNQTILERTKQLAKLCRKRNIKPIFILVPKNLNEQSIALYKALNSELKIELIDARKYPEYYAIDNCFDIGHLNDLGGQIISKEFARLLGEIIQK